MGTDSDDPGRPREDGAEDGEEWAVSLEDLASREEHREENAELERIRQRDPQPQPIAAESAAFVLLGVLATILTVYIGLL